MKNYLDSKHYGYACDIARDGKAKTVVDLLERIDELEAELLSSGLNQVARDKIERLARDKEYALQANEKVKLAAEQRIKELEKIRKFHIREIDRLDAALAECERAIDFHDKVQGATSAERLAVRTDNIDWCISACRDAKKARAGE